LQEELELARAGRTTLEKPPKDLKLANITALPMGCSLQQYNSWMMDLERAHISQPQTLYNHCTKVIHALDHVDKECRNRWDTYVKSKVEGGKSVFDYYDWDEFKKFSVNYKKDPQDLSGSVQASLNAAYQKEKQDPWAFHQYLETLELEREPRSERERSDFFLSRLLGWLQGHIRSNHAMSMPKTRNDMVRLAQAVWVSTPEAVRKRRHEETKPRREETSETPNKRMRGIHQEQSPRSRGGSFSVLRNRGRVARTQGNRGRGSTNTRGSKSSGTPSETIPNQNPLDEQGNPTKCFRCGSTYHYSNSCPIPAEAEAQVSQVRGRGNSYYRGSRGYRSLRGSRRGAGQDASRSQHSTTNTQEG
jgi:hypothetical protein